MGLFRPRKFLQQLAKEPPFRLFCRAAVSALPLSIRTKANWDAIRRPQYLIGVLRGADQARREGAPSICAIEFGVAGGNGLLLLEQYARLVEQETGIKVFVYGFDSGSGLPDHCGDYRDHPDHWRPGDYPMDEAKLRSRLGRQTQLILGPVAETAPAFVDREQPAPIGFVAFDLDLYSATKEALQVFSHPRHQLLRRVPLYFDDVSSIVNHRFAGELLAIDEFNDSCQVVKIDRWRGLDTGRPFDNAPYLRKMYVAHNLEAINNAAPTRSPRDKPRFALS